MKQIWFPEPHFIGIYRTGKDDSSVVEDIQSEGIELTAEDIVQLREAIRENIIARLPADFQWGRTSDGNESLMTLYTTRKSKLTREKSLWE